jgi:tryptophanyl-tRNA synthetase
MIATSAHQDGGAAPIDSKPAVRRVLTGITTSGTPHLGNYVGAIRPTVQASRAPGTESFLFLADYHALVKTGGDPARVQRSTLEIAASWLASGLDPQRTFFYRQSDIPEIPELTWMLTCVTGKGLLNRAHAYKAATDKNTAAGLDTDADVTGGLYMYPVLMAADILVFHAHKVPVGRDQVQHIEMARDMAASFNHLHGQGRALLTLPEAVIDEHVAVLPGLDGRKMSKSYDNTIALFGSREQLRKQIASLVTDSKAPGEPKATQGSALFQIYQAFASPSETAAFAQAFADGISWADAKAALLERIDREIAPMRETYNAFMAEPQQVENILQRGAERARVRSSALLRELRHAVGLRPLGSVAAVSRKTAAKVGKPAFKQYRESDGLFYFKLLDASGTVLLQSQGFAAPRDAAQAMARLQQDAGAALAELADRLAPGYDASAVVQALQSLQKE